MKLEAIERQLGRPPKENVGQVGPNFEKRRSNAILAEQAGESVKQIQRYIRLTNLVPELLTDLKNWRRMQWIIMENEEV